MTIYVVRHAKAGRRSDWNGEDVLRPLSQRGWNQATLLAERLAPLAPTALLSSPSVRCRQTLEPLAELVGLSIHNDDALREETTLDDVLELLDRIPDGTVCSSHGDVIPEVIGALNRRGMRVDCEPDWRKASVWLLERDDSGFARATVWSPP